MKKNNWVYKVFLCTFILSVIFSFITNFLSSHSNIFIMILIITIVIALGIIFDMIGASSLTSKEATFHSMSSKKIKGAKETIKLIKNNAKVSSVCNDIVGDICGIITGSITASLVVFLYDTPFTAIILTAIVSSVTVGGKAIGKKIATKKNEKIVSNVGTVLSVFKRGK